MFRNVRLYCLFELQDALGKQTVNQPREILLRTIADLTTRVKYDFTLLKNVISEIIPQTEISGWFSFGKLLIFSIWLESDLMLVDFYPGVMVPKQDLPSFFILLLCDTLLCKVQMAIDDSMSKSSENDLNKYVNRFSWRTKVIRLTLL